MMLKSCRLQKLVQIFALEIYRFMYINSHVYNSHTL